MSAWEITPEDVADVLAAHGQSSCDGLHDDVIQEAGRVEHAVLCYTDFNDQCAAAASEIEDILIEDGCIDASKQFHCP